MERMDCFEERISRADFFTVKLSTSFRNYLASLVPQKNNAGVLDYERNYGDIHILIEVMEGVYAVYLKDYNFGHIKPLGECIYEIESDDLEDSEQIVYDYVLPDLQRKFECHMIDMDKELYDYYHILPDAYIPFIEGKISDKVTVGEAARILGV